jgi:hypothetical protein
MFYVDEIHGGWCHLIADSDSELEAVARKLHLRPEWKHGDHYDLRPRKRAQAVRLGAKEVSSTEIVEVRMRLRGDAEEDIRQFREKSRTRRK